MAETVFSEAVGQLMDLVKKQAVYRVKLVRGAKKEARGLKQKLKMLNDVLDDAENRRFKDESVKNWLFRFQQTSNEMEDILDEWDFAILKLKREEHQSDDAAVAPLKHKVRSFLVSSFSCVCFNKLAVRHEIALKIENVKGQFDELFKDKDLYSLVMSQPTEYRPPNRSTVSFTKVEDMRGRDSVTNDLVTMLMSNCRTPQVVSVVGVGGLGKTTIAQLVYNHKHVEKHFDLRIWVCVSNPFDVAAIAKVIIKRATNEDLSSTNDLETLLSRVRKEISGKKLLLVLDDVWEEQHSKWRQLEIYLSEGGEGSKILVTTRKESVAKIMGTIKGNILHPNKLSDEDCWLLMRRIACPGWDGRTDSEEIRKLEETGKEIAEKCGGLPLAATTLGSLLRTKSTLEKWKGVLRNGIWEMKEAEVELFPHLLLSYNELSPTLKRCFSFCAVFPKGTKIHVEELIRYWMALGYLGSDATSCSMEDRGQEYFEIIAMHSLMQDFEKEYEPDGKILYCKMHDIVHDFAKFLRKSSQVEATSTNKCQTCQDRDLDPSQISSVNEFRSFFWDGKESPPDLCDCLTRLRVLSLRRCNLQIIPQIMEKFIHLRWLNLSGNELSHEDLKIIFKLYSLKTLNLSHCSLEEIPAEIGNLTNSRYLNLGNNGLKKLPKEIGKLIRLTHLKLSSNDCLTELPEEIWSLINLTHLDLSWDIPCTNSSGDRVHNNKSMTEVPRGIENLIHLRKLDLSWNESLEKLPETIRGLLELRILDVEGCTKLWEVPERLAQLTSLSSLREFKGGSAWSKLGLLKNLTHLGKHVRLIIRLGGDNDLESVVEDAWEAKLRNRKEISKLEITFEDEMDEKEESCSRIRKGVIDALEPHPDLQFLRIEKYKDSKLPGWIVSSLKQLSMVILKKCHHLKALPSLGKLPWMKFLIIEDMDELEMVGQEFFGFPECSSNAPVISFPRLTHLSIRGCGKWKEWEDITPEEEASPACSVMKNIKELEILDCNGLTALPHRLIRKTRLQRLRISGSTQLQQRYLNKGGFLTVDGIIYEEWREGIYMPFKMRSNYGSSAYPLVYPGYYIPMPPGEYGRPGDYIRMPQEANISEHEGASGSVPNPTEEEPQSDTNRRGSTAVSEEEEPQVQIDTHIRGLNMDNRSGDERVEPIPISGDNITEIAPPHFVNAQLINERDITDPTINTTQQSQITNEEWYIPPPTPNIQGPPMFQ